MKHKKPSILIVPIVLLTGIIMLFSSCKEKEKEKTHIPEIPTVKVVQKDITIYQQFVGQVYGYYDIPIRTRVAGFLKGIYFKEGSRVTKGELLYTIDSDPFLAKVAIAKSKKSEAETSLIKAKNDLNRIEPLAKINAVSKSDWDAAKARYNAALAYLDAANSNLKYENINLGYCRISSPINGIIGKTKAKVGEFVGQNPNPIILNTVSAIDSIHVQFYLAEDEYLRLAREFFKTTKVDNQNLKKDKDAGLSLILADGSTFKYKGFVDFINREVDPKTGSLLIETTFPNNDYLLRPGQYAKVVVPIKKEKNALIIPQRCVMEMQGRFSVYVVNDTNTVVSRVVQTGEKAGNMWIIKKGLKAGDKIVIDALQNVYEGLKINPVQSDFKSIITQQ